MTSSTDTMSDLSALERQTELFDLDAELIGPTVDEAAAEAPQVGAVSSVARAARKEQRAMTAAWIALFVGLVVSLGSFASIARHDSVAANGPSTATATTAP